MAKKNVAAGALNTKHWLGYMFGDFGGCMTFTLMSKLNIWHRKNVTLF